MIDIKLTKRCKNCNCKLPSKSKHHFYCDRCWLKHKEKICLLVDEKNLIRKLKPLRKIK